MQVKVIDGRSELSLQKNQSPCCSITRWGLGCRHIYLFWTIQKTLFIPPEIESTVVWEYCGFISSCPEWLLVEAHLVWLVVEVAQNRTLNKEQKIHALKVKNMHMKQPVSRAGSAAAVLSLHLSVWPSASLPALFQLGAVCAGCVCRNPGVPQQSPSKQ